MIRFVAECGATEPLEGLLVYRESEYSFRFDPASPGEVSRRAGASGTTSLAIGTLQIEVGVDTGSVLFVWGLHPRARWEQFGLGRPDTRPGLVHVVTDRPLHAGIAVAMAEVGEWATGFDSETGWARVSCDLSRHDADIILVATGAAVGLVDERLHSVWLHPFIETS